MAELLTVQIHVHSECKTANVFQVTKRKTTSNHTSRYEDAKIDGMGITQENTRVSNQLMPASMSFVSKQIPINIQFAHIKYSVSAGWSKGLKTILHDLSGDLHCGKLAAIMGPSGAGKSTLMNILTGYTRDKSVEGQILVNGKERNLRRFRKLSCYIMQNNHLLPHLTVLEAMSYSASLKLPEKTPPATKQAVIDEILTTLSLFDARMTRTNKLSGGQQKRLSIALELINMPSVMFFDEPTSGIDSASCYQCINLLKSLARGGRTIVCTIHQPSAKIFNMFDHLYMLADGQCMYSGSATELVPYLASFGLSCPAYHNPADYVMEIAAGEYGKIVPSLVKATKNEIKERLSSENNNRNVDEWCTSELTDSKERSCCNFGEEVSLYATSWCTQFTVLFKRTFICIIRDATLTRFRLISHIAVAILIGVLYLNMGNDSGKIFNNNSLLFINVFFLVFTALMPTTVTFPLEMSVFSHEHLNHWYGLKAFYLAKTLADMPFQIIFPAVYVCIVYWMTNQPFETYRFGMCMLICILTSFVAQSQGLLIGASMRVHVAVFAAPVTAMPIFLFCGYFINFNAMSNYIRWFSYCSYMRYSFEGMMQAMYGFDRAMFECSNDDEIKGRCIFRYPEHMLQQLNVESANFHVDVIVLCAYFIFLRICCYILLRFRTKMH